MGWKSALLTVSILMKSKIEKNSPIYSFLSTKISEKLRYKTHTSGSTGKEWNLRTDCQAVKGTGYEEIMLPNGEPGWNHFTFTERGHFEYLEGAPGIN